MKKLTCLILIIILCFFIVGCEKQQEDPVEKDLETVKTITNVFEDELASFGVDEKMVDDAISKVIEYNNKTECVIAFDIKNEAVAILNMTIHLPVEKEFFDSVEIGHEITEDEIKSIDGVGQIDFSLDGWTITVKDKIERE